MPELRVQVHMTVPVPPELGLTVPVVAHVLAPVRDLRVQALTVVAETGPDGRWYLLRATAHGVVAEYEPDELDETWEGEAFEAEAPQSLWAIAAPLLAKLRRHGLVVEGARG